MIADSFGTFQANIISPQEGEAIYHIAYFKAPDTVAEQVELLQDNLVSTESTLVL